MGVNLITLKHFHNVKNKLSYFYNHYGFSDLPHFQYMEESVSFEHYKLLLLDPGLFSDEMEHSVDNYLSYNMEDIQ